MIDLTLLDSHLRVVGNDPIRTMYERSKISFFTSTTTQGDSYIRLEYESNPMARLFPNDVTGDGVALTSLDEIVAYLSPIADGATSGGPSAGGTTGGSGGGGLTQAQTQAAVSSAIDSAADIDTIISSLGKIADAAESGNSIKVFVGTADNTSTVVVTANSNAKETLIHNKDSKETLYLKLKISVDDVATASASLELPPKGYVAFFGYKATLPVMVLTANNTISVDYYIEQVEYIAP